QSTSRITNLTAKFTDARNRTFVQPTDDSLRTAMRLATPDEKTHTWPIPYAKLRTSAGAKANPGTMAAYAAVPTPGLKPEGATHLADLRRFASRDGQKPGIGEGQLPSGYVPMTPENGLGALADYTRRAADAVAAQQRAVPPLKPGRVSNGGSGGGGGGSGGV